MLCIYEISYARFIKIHTLGGAPLGVYMVSVSPTWIGHSKYRHRNLCVRSSGLISDKYFPVYSISDFTFQFFFRHLAGAFFGGPPSSQFYSSDYLHQVSDAQCDCPTHICFALIGFDIETETGTFNVANSQPYFKSFCRNSGESPSRIRNHLFRPCWRLSLIASRVSLRIAAQTDQVRPFFLFGSSPLSLPYTAWSLMTFYLCRSLADSF